MKKLLFGLLLTGALFTTACSDDAKKANGEACTAASECESNNCDATSNKCAPVAPVKKADGETCTASSECQSNNCDTSVTPHVCKAAKKGDGETCTKNDECASNECDATSKTCKISAGHECTATAECAKAFPGVTPACIDAESGKKRCSVICTGAGQCPSPYACMSAKEGTKDVLACSIKPRKGTVKDGQPCSLEADANEECETAGHVCDATTHTCKASS